MFKKLKFKPIITRVKLNPEQAVLTCPGYSYGWDGAVPSGSSWIEYNACWSNIPKSRGSGLADPGDISS